MRWAEIAEQQPALAAVAADKLIKPGVLLAGTVRRDGTARVSGVEPLVMDGDLWLSMMPSSAKVRDLDRDGRIVLNSIITGPGPDAEVKVRGTAEMVSDPQVHGRYAAAVASGLGWQPVPGEFTLLVIEVRDITYIGYDEVTRGQHVARWPGGREYIRPAVTPTSLGPEQYVSRLLR